MERLTARMENGKACYSCSFKWQEENEQTVLDRLAELEDKLESGNLIELPCIRKVEFKISLLDKENPIINYELLYANEYGQLMKDLFSENDKTKAEARLKELQGKL